MEKQELDQIVSEVAKAVNESFGARVDAIEAEVKSMKSMAEGAVAEPSGAPAAEDDKPEAGPEAKEPESESEDKPEAAKEPEAEPAAKTEEPEPEAESSNDLSSADAEELRQLRADKAAAALSAEVQKQVAAALAAKKHGIPPAPPAKPSAKESPGDDLRAAYAKQFSTETGIDFELAFAPLSKKSRTLSTVETQLKNQFMRQHGPPKSAA